MHLYISPKNNFKKLLILSKLGISAPSKPSRSSSPLIMLYFYLQNGELDLTFHIYRLSFLNFLLGKQANGPGQYLFGTVTPETPTCMFPIGKYKDPWRNRWITQNWPWTIEQFGRTLNPFSKFIKIKKWTTLLFFMPFHKKPVNSVNSMLYSEL